MTKPDIGQTAPDFTLPADNGEDITLSALRGKTVILYFYPKDDTPGCTTESCEFRDALPAFENLDAVIIGISKCSIKKHIKFKEKYGLNFPLLSDENDNVCKDYGVWVEKSMYGKKYMGIERSTFVIDKDRKIAAVWRKVSVTGHVDEVRKSLQTLKATA